MLVTYAVHLFFTMRLATVEWIAQLFINLFISKNMSYIYIKTLAAQEGYKTLTVACLKH